jgi:LysR family hydrogen peroxide-inducible transcriptional activator
LRAHGRLLAAAAGSKELSGSFTLGIIPTLAHFVLPWFLGAFADQHPDVVLNLVERNTETIVSEIRAMRMDGGVVATPLGEAGIERRVLFYDPFYVYAQVGSPLLTRHEVQVADIERDDLWLLEDGHCFRNQVVHLCGLHNRNLLGNVHFAGGSFDTLRAIIDRAGGFTVVPESYARTLPARVRLERVRPFADDAPTREVSLVSHRAQWKTDILEALAISLREHAPRSLPREPGSSQVMSIQAG